MPVDFDNVLNGPAEVLIDDILLSHTQGGASIQVSPQTRAVMVDQFGNGECNIVDIGLTARATIPFGEWSDAVLEQLSPVGADGTYYWGLGNEAGGYITAVDLKIVPFVTANENKRVEIYRAAAVGQYTLNFGVQQQIIAEQQYACLVDEDLDDGDRIMRLQFAASL